MPFSLINLSLQPAADMSQIDVIVAFMIILAFLISIALHECGHALMASWLGDNTPRMEGRQTLHFRPHIDPVGLLMCIILAFQPVGAPPVGLGWGKPIKPDPWKMKVKPDTGVLLVACAGIVTSLLVGLIITAVLAFVGTSLQGNIPGQFLLAFLIIFGLVNIAMAIFNLIPLYPLDGYQIVYTLLPSKQALKFARSAPYGPFLILIIFFFLPFIGNLTHASSFFLFHLSFYIWQVAALVMHLLGSPISLYSL
jgi:Zn-dependent protease